MIWGMILASVGIAAVVWFFGWLMEAIPTGALLGVAGILGIYSIIIWRVEG